MSEATREQMAQALVVALWRDPEASEYDLADAVLQSVGSDIYRVLGGQQTHCSPSAGAIWSESDGWLVPVVETPDPMSNLDPERHRRAGEKAAREALDRAFDAVSPDPTPEWMLWTEFRAFDGNTRESYLIGPFQSEADAYQFEVGFPGLSKAARRVVSPQEWERGER